MAVGCYNYEPLLIIKKSTKVMILDLDLAICNELIQTKIVSENCRKDQSDSAFNMSMTANLQKVKL